MIVVWYAYVWGETMNLIMVIGLGIKQLGQTIA